MRGGFNDLFYMKYFLVDGRGEKHDFQNPAVQGALIAGREAIIARDLQPITIVRPAKIDGTIHNNRNGKIPEGLPFCVMTRYLWLIPV